MNEVDAMTFRRHSSRGDL